MDRTLSAHGESAAVGGGPRRLVSRALVPAPSAMAACALAAAARRCALRFVAHRARCTLVLAAARARRDAALSRARDRGGACPACGGRRAGAVALFRRAVTLSPGHAQRGVHVYLAEAGPCLAGRGTGGRAVLVAGSGWRHGRWR